MGRTKKQEKDDVWAQERDMLLMCTLKRPWESMQNLFEVVQNAPADADVYELLKEQLER